MNDTSAIHRGPALLVDLYADLGASGLDVWCINEFNHHTMHNLLAALLLLFGTAYSIAQPSNAFVLEDADYRVTYQEDSLQVFWRGEPAGEQLQQFDPHRALLRDEQGRPRLLLYPGDPFQYYDLAYADTTWFNYALEAMTDESVAIEEKRSSLPDGLRYADPTSPLVITFSNGLIMSIHPGSASAKLAGTPLPVTGREGRYRVITSDFEAGVAVQANGKLYKYLRHK